MTDRTEWLSCELNETEVRERGEEAARKQGERDEKEAERVADQKSRKAIVETLESQVRHLLGEVRTRRTKREVEIVDEAHHDTGTMVTIRKDTGEIVRTRPLNADERQAKLFPISPQTGATASGEPAGKEF